MILGDELDLACIITHYNALTSSEYIGAIDRVY